MRKSGTRAGKNIQNAFRRMAGLTTGIAVVGSVAACASAPKYAPDSDVGRRSVQVKEGSTGEISYYGLGIADFTVGPLEENEATLLLTMGDKQFPISVSFDDNAGRSRHLELVNLCSASGVELDINTVGMLTSGGKEIARFKVSSLWTAGVILLVAIERNAIMMELGYGRTMLLSNRNGGHAKLTLCPPKWDVGNIAELENRDNINPPRMMTFVTSSGATIESFEIPHR